MEKEIKMSWDKTAEDVGNEIVITTKTGDIISGICTERNQGTSEYRVQTSAGIVEGTFKYSPKYCQEGFCK